MKSVFDKEFAVYGKVVEGYDFAPLLKVLRENSGKPADCTIMFQATPRWRRLRLIGFFPIICSAVCRFKSATATAITGS